jgi:hypothetical protein
MMLLLSFWLVQHIASHTKNRQIATALLEMHHQWATNNYQPKTQGMLMPAPPMLTNKDISAWSAGILGAYVMYDELKDGIEWDRMLHLFRVNTNTTEWTLYEAAQPKDTNLLGMAWQHKLVTVTGEP